MDRKVFWLSGQVILAALVFLLAGCASKDTRYELIESTWKLCTMRYASSYYRYMANHLHEDRPHYEMERSHFRQQFWKELGKSNWDTELRGVHIVELTDTLAIVNAYTLRQHEKEQARTGHSAVYLQKKSRWAMENPRDRLVISKKGLSFLL